MISVQNMNLPEDDKTSEQQLARSDALQHVGLNPSLFASLAGQGYNVPSSLNASSLNARQQAGLGLGYPLGFSGSIPASLQAQLLMGRSHLLNPFPGLSASSHLNPLNQSAFASGMQALQQSNGSQDQQQSQQRGRPNANEIKEALATLAAATAPVGASSGPQKSTSATTQASLPVVVFMDCDEESLSDYQCLLRKQIELFEATTNDVQWNAQGRNKAIVLGQVGIRCRWCANLPTWSRSRGAVYYSATLDGLYQAAQNMAKNHLCKHCRYIPADVRQNLTGLRECKRRAAGGKKYWAEGAKVLGIYQCEDGLRFKNSKIPAPAKNNNSEIERQSSQLTM
ncbi:unnamed protein product [Cylindrotheca closterium]|uniref:Uncharacterized protein n=1 Tax=Cylindrotheca closterium TaxID=2856 RepID=A0AAD2G9E6_9STRA|nr:unnamed protein product [Cylindrotheca closterium]